MRRSPRRCASATSSARCCPTWCSAACARRSRTACRPRAPRACGTSTCAARAQGGDGGNYGFTMAVTSQRRHRRAARQGRAVGHRLSVAACKGTPVEIAESHDAADLLDEGAAPGFRRRRPHPRRPRPDHRDRERHRPSRSTSWPPSTASTIRRAAATAGGDGAAGYVGAQVGPEAARQGLPGDPAGRAAGGDDAGRRRHRRAGASASGGSSRAIWRKGWSRRKPARLFMGALDKASM